MRFAIVFILLLVVCNSCTIEKRLYGKGYHVTWHKRYSKNKKENVAKKLEEETIDTLSSIPENEEPVIEAPDLGFPKEDSLAVSREEHKATKYPDLPKDERRFEPLGVLAFKLLLLDIPIGLIGDNVTDHATVNQMEFLFSAVLLISFVLAVISMIRYLRHPKHYRFNFYAIIVILVFLFFFIEFLLGNFKFFVDLVY